MYISAMHAWYEKMPMYYDELSLQFDECMMGSYGLLGCIFSNATSSCHIEINIFITWSTNVMTGTIQKSSLRNMADEARTGPLHWWHYFC
jgi:hypothetical protein